MISSLTALPVTRTATIPWSNVVYPSLRNLICLSPGAPQTGSRKGKGGGRRAPSSLARSGRGTVPRSPTARLRPQGLQSYPRGVNPPGRAPAPWGPPGLPPAPPCTAGVAVSRVRAGHRGGCPRNRRGGREKGGGRLCPQGPAPDPPPTLRRELSNGSQRPSGSVPLCPPQHPAPLWRRSVHREPAPCSGAPRPRCQSLAARAAGSGERPPLLRREPAGRGTGSGRGLPPSLWVGGGCPRGAGACVRGRLGQLGRSPSRWPGGLVGSQ